MVYKLIYLLIQRFSKEKGYSAIKVEGELNDSSIENNVTVGGPLLDAKKVKNCSVKGNLTYLPSPKDMHWIWKGLLDVFVGLLIFFL